jgi:hypothetical protein
VRVLEEKAFILRNDWAYASLCAADFQRSPLPTIFERGDECRPALDETCSTSFGDVFVQSRRFVITTGNKRKLEQVVGRTPVVGSLASPKIRGGWSGRWNPSEPRPQQSDPRIMVLPRPPPSMNLSVKGAFNPGRRLPGRRCDNVSQTTDA